MIRMARRSPAKRPPPATPEEGAAYVRKFMLELFDRKDGEAADWSLIARTLFVAAFDAADRLPRDNARHALLRRVHEGAYNRLAHLKHHEIASGWARGTYKSVKTLWHYTSESSAVRKARYSGSGRQL